VAPSKHALLISLMLLEEITGRISKTSALRFAPNLERSLRVRSIFTARTDETGDSPIAGEHQMIPHACFDVPLPVAGSTQIGLPSRVIAISFR